MTDYQDALVLENFVLSIPKSTYERTDYLWLSKAELTHGPC